MSGRILNPRVARIEIAGQNASISREENTFSLADVTLNSSTNDYVYRVYDDDNEMIYKHVLTLYSGSASASSSATATSVTSYNLSNDQFKIISPATDVYTTSETVIRIDGRVPVGAVDAITVNDYKLQKFPSGGKNWYYFANKQYGTMTDGVNLYTIRYFDAQGKKLYEHAFTIINKPAPAPVASTGAVTSGEAAIQ